jgi:hypothetical protein
MTSSPSAGAGSTWAWAGADPGTIAADTTNPSPAAAIPACDRTSRIIVLRDGISRSLLGRPHPGPVRFVFCHLRGYTANCQKKKLLRLLEVL